MLYSFSILYLTTNENISSGDEGVSKKLISKIKAIQKICPNSILLNANLNLSHNEFKLIEKNNYYINVEIGVKEANVGYLNKIKSDNLFYKKLGDYIQANTIPCDRIIFRYPFATSGLNYFTKKFNKKIVFEHNSKELEELCFNIENKRYAPFSIIPSRFFYWYQEKKYPIYAEKNLFREITAHACAGSCVTTEIAEYEKQRNPDYKTFVSSNFYDFSNIPLATSHYNGTEILSLGMIVTTMAPWYGLDRLLRSFAPFQKKYKLVIAGVSDTDQKIKKLITEYKISENICFLGKINKNQLVSFYNSVHVCFGSLGLYNLNLNYASTLKVKESLAFGIPVVVGYKEEDFTSYKDFLPFYVQLSNDDSLIDFDSIEKFVSKFYSDKENKIKLRQLALKYMDVDVKMKALVENIKPI
jgi:glycosyltransferase involved in cell wall biosynthesis